MDIKKQLTRKYIHCTCTVASLYPGSRLTMTKNCNTFLINDILSKWTEKFYLRNCLCVNLCIHKILETCAF